MNKLTLSITAAAVTSFLAVGTVSADFQGISVDQFDSGLGIGTTYRIYVDVLVGDQVDAIFGDGADPLLINTLGGGSFYQNMFGGATSTTISPALFGLFPSLEYDSFVTIGRLTNVDNALLDIGVPWGTFEAGGAISTSNGSWFATPDDAQVMEVGGRVLIAQLTTTGDFEGVVSMIGKNADLSNWEARSVTFSSLPVPAPGALALLGFAGIAATRRRK